MIRIISKDNSWVGDDDGYRGCFEKPNDKAFLNKVSDEKKRLDSFAVLELMQEVTGMQPKLWGDAIIGFGNYHYHYKSGREGDWFLVGFSPRKQNLTHYIMSGFEEYDTLMSKLGKYKTGKACLYIKALEDLELILRELVKQSVEHLVASNA